MATRRNGGTGAATDGRLHAPRDGITVRMYRTGLGDCFLLALPRAQADAGGRADFYMLIDCGVYFRTPAIANPVTKEEFSQEAWIKKIANHIKTRRRGSSRRLTSAASGWRGRRTCRSSWPAS
jgi:hypothetical protein